MASGLQSSFLEFAARPHLVQIWVGLVTKSMYEPMSPLSDFFRSQSCFFDIAVGPFESAVGI